MGIVIVLSVIGAAIVLTSIIIWGDGGFFDPDDLPTTIGFTFIGLLVGMMAGLMAAKISNEIAFNNAETKINTVEIVSASSQAQVEGEVGGFIIFNGSIETKEYFMTFKTRDDGGYVRAKFPAGETIIYEKDTKNPHVDIHYKELEDGWFIYQDRKIVQYKMYVPKDTIIKKFDIR